MSDIIYSNKLKSTELVHSVDIISINFTVRPETIRAVQVTTLHKYLMLQLLQTHQEEKISLGVFVRL